MESQTTEPTEPQAQAQAEPQAIEPSASEPTTGADKLKADEPKVEHRSMRAELREHLRKGAEKPKAEPKEQPKAAPQAAAFEPILPPPSLNAEERAAWDTLTPEMKKFVSRRAHETQSDYTRKMQELTAKEREYPELDQLKPVREEYARQGIKLTDVVHRSVAWDKALKADPINAAREFLSTYGIDPSELLEANQGQAQAPQQQAQAGNYLTREELQELLQQQQQRAVQQSYMQTAMSELETFRKSKPLFRDAGTAEQLENTMRPIVAGLKAENPSRPVREILEEAYSYVTSGNPQFAELVKQFSAREAAEKASAEAQKAMSASRSISGGPGSGTPKRNLTQREELMLRFKGAL